jgi:hypothetical protein
MIQFSRLKLIVQIYGRLIGILLRKVKHLALWYYNTVKFP